jgi:hypothetical protein
MNMMGRQQNGNNQSRTNSGSSNGKVTKVYDNVFKVDDVNTLAPKSENHDEIPIFNFNPVPSLQEQHVEESKYEMV